MQGVIQPIVEGHGEIEAFPVLLRRIANEFGVNDCKILKPLLHHRSDFNREDKVRKAVCLAQLKLAGYAKLRHGIFILFDLDDDCLKNKADDLWAWTKFKGLLIPTFTAFAVMEYEAWFLAGLIPLRERLKIPEHVKPPTNPEEIRAAKEWIGNRMKDRRQYSPTTHQAPCSQYFSLADAYRACRSFRKLVSEFEKALTAIGCSPKRPDWVS